MSARVIDIHSRATWEAVREEYSKTKQMGWQSVLQAAKVGAMLIELKAETEYGEFRANVQRVGLLKSTAHNLMRLAANMELLEQRKPDSQREALAMIAQKHPKRTKSKAAFKMGWRVALENFAGYSTWAGSTDLRSKITAKLGAFPTFFLDNESAQKFANEFIKAFPNKAMADKPELSPTAKQKLDRAIAIETARLREKFEEQLYAEVDRRIPEITAERKQAIRENTEETARYAAIVKGTKKLITADEYRFLLQTLHPDRAPEERKDQFARAFQIVMKLKNYAEA